MYGAMGMMARRAVNPGERFMLPGGIEAKLFIVPGKLPLYLEGEAPELGTESAANVGVELLREGARMVFVPGTRPVTPAMRERFARADVVLFDGTLFTDDEMIRMQTGQKTGRRMGHMQIDGDSGSLRRLSRIVGAAYLCPYQQHQSDPDRWLRRAAQSRECRVGSRRGWYGDRAVKLLTPEELEAALRDIGAGVIIACIRFIALLHGGKCSKGQVQAWALNRYYYQAMIPIKDASLIARCEDPAVRREWRSRLVDHDGEREGDGGIARWLKLTDGLGLERDYVTSLRGLLPGTRFAVDAYVHFVREKTLLEAIASSLTEMFSPVIISERMAGMLANYDFITRETLSLFRQTPAAGAARRRFRAQFRQAQRAEPRSSSRRCSPRWSSNAAFSGRCWMRCITRMCRRGTSRQALSCRRDNDGWSGGQVSDGARPRLPRGVRLTHNEAQGGWVLLAPERVFKADAITAEILKRCTGEATLAAIVDDLAATFAAPRERIHADVAKLLAGLAEKKLLELG